MTPERFQQIEQLCHSVLEREANQRAAFLEQACASDDALRREVESLLAQQTKGERLFEAPLPWPTAKEQAQAPHLTEGRQLGSYQILSLLGSGGMGEVYKAKDDRLERTVAIKVLAGHLADRADLRQRFEREARTIASLKHPNICVLYDIGSEDGLDYLVMEHLEGETLDQRLTKGPLRIDQVLRYAVEMADALDKVHRQGLIHRDLKPGNIMLTKSGSKLLDFGLAKLREDGSSAPGATATPPISTPGTMVGTLPYMAPEQLEGKEVDARTDIFAFGSVVYEMVTGEKPFRGESQGGLIAAIVQNEPPSVSTLCPGAPPLLDHIIKRCLAKDPDERWQTAGDLMRELKWAIEGGSQAPIPTLHTLRRSIRERVAWTVVAIAITAIGTLTSHLHFTRSVPVHPLIHLDAEIAPQVIAADVMLALSPDGTRLVLPLRSEDGYVRLHTRLLDRNQIVPIPGTENARLPFFSPDGEWIGFFADGKLKKISVEGGAAVTLCDAANLRGASWGDDGNIIAALNTTGGLSRVPSSGGAPVPVTTLKPGETTHRWPQVLPGSQAVLFNSSARGASFDDANVEVVSLKTGERRTIQHGGFSARYLPLSDRTGHLIYMRQHTLFDAPFDFRRLTLAGVPVPILGDVSSNSAAGGEYAYGGAPSGPGTLIYLPAGQEGWTISLLDRAGQVRPLYTPVGHYSVPRFSPDGKRLAFHSGDGQESDIWVKNLDRGTLSRLTFLGGQNSWFVWSPNGKNIVFSSTTPGAPGLYWTRSDGSGEAQRLTDGKRAETAYSFSPDGKRLAWFQIGNGRSTDIFTAAIEVKAGGSFGGVQLGKPEVFLGAPFDEQYPTFSPDGHWLAYTSNDSGTYEVYVRPFPGPGGRWQISNGGGLFPVWSRKGKEILFEGLDQRLMAAEYSVNGDSFVAGPPRVWSSTPILGLNLTPNFDLAPDGRTAAVTLASDVAGGEKRTAHLTFLLNFFDELRRRVPVSK